MPDFLVWSCEEGVAAIMRERLPITGGGHKY